MREAELTEIECWSSSDFFEQSVNMAAKEIESEAKANPVLKGMKRLERFLLGDQ